MTLPINWSRNCTHFVSIIFTISIVKIKIIDFKMPRYQESCIVFLIVKSIVYADESARFKRTSQALSGHKGCAISVCF